MRPSWEVWLAAAAACIPLAALSDRAFNIDEPLFLWLAEQISREPTDFFGFDVNWYGSAQPMYAVTRNPPLVGYAIAAAAALVGWSERALHLVFLVPAGGAAAGTLWIGRRTTTRPLLAVLVALWTPVFLLSSSTVMCDTTMLALWCAAIACWLRAARGAPRAAAGWLWAAGVLAAIATLVKYFAVALVPLLALHALVARLPPRRFAPPLVLPIAALAAFELWMFGRYGAGALAQAAGEALHVVGIERPGALRQAAEGLAFAGGCVAAALLFAPLLWSRRALLAGSPGWGCRCRPAPSPRCSGASGCSRCSSSR